MINKQQNNRLKIPILQVLREQKTPLSEYQLIQQLESKGFAANILGDNSAALYRGHFLVMNALYQWQAELIETGIYLRISALEIALEAATAGAGRQLAEGSEELAEYYLDWHNFSLAPEQIDALLGSFWQKFLSPERIADAYRILGLSPGDDQQSIAMAYRRLARRHHPDRGGDAAQFLAVREAYELLRQR